MNVHITCSRSKTVCCDINRYGDMFIVFFGAINATDSHMVQGKDKVLAHSVICVVLARVSRACALLRTTTCYALHFSKLLAAN